MRCVDVTLDRVQSGWQHSAKLVFIEECGHVRGRATAVPI